MLNNVVLVGRITKDPENRSSSEVVKFNLAVNRPFKNNNGEYEADFINCTAFGKTANNMMNYVKKGMLLAVTGRIQTGSYENNEGQRIYVTEVVANNVTFLESKKNKEEKIDFYEEQQKEDPMFRDFIKAEGKMNGYLKNEDEDLPF